MAGPGERSSDHPRPWVTSAAAALTLSALAVAGMIGLQVKANGHGLRDWDLMFATGTLTFLAVLWLTRGLPASFAVMVERLVDRRALVSEDEPAQAVSAPAILAEVDGIVGRLQRRWAVASATLMGIAVLAGALSVGYQDKTVVVLSIAFVSAGSYVVGLEVGRALAYSRLARLLARRGIAFRARPAHVDGAGGLRPFGDFYLHQSLLLAIPLVYFLIWSLLLLTPAFEGRYEAWGTVAPVLFGVLFVLELAALAAPLAPVHRAMRGQKREWLRTTDTVRLEELMRAEDELAGDLDPERRAVVSARRDRLVRAFRDIESSPTWPLDRALRRRVTLGNVLVLLPLATQLTTQLAKALAK
jgi:hypothetical protein